MFSTNNYFTHAQYMHDHLPLVTNNDKLYAWQSQLGINLFSEGNTWLGLDTASQDSLKHIVQMCWFFSLDKKKSIPAQRFSIPV